MNYLGIDIGGTFIKYGLVDDIARITNRGRVETADSLDGLVEQVAGIAAGETGEQIEAIGIGIPGFISQKEKIIKRSPNIRFLDGVAFGEAVQERTGVPVVMENDANVAAYGEFSLLPDPKPGSFIHLTLGTGIGAGIILNHNIWTGEGGYAGELGHHIVNPEGRPCGCGGRGCIETEASATALVNSYKEFAIEFAKEFAGDDGKKHSEPITSEDIHERFLSGDEAAVKTFERAGYYLGIFLCSVINGLNPARISLGGGAAAAGGALMKPAMEQLNQRLGQYVLDCTVIEVPNGQSETGLIGAALWAKKEKKEVLT